MGQHTVRSNRRDSEGQDQNGTLHVCMCEFTHTHTHMCMYMCVCMCMCVCVCDMCIMFDQGHEIDTYKCIQTDIYVCIHWQLREQQDEMRRIIREGPAGACTECEQTHTPHPHITHVCIHMCVCV